MNITSIGLTAALLTTSSFIPQVFKIYKTKCVEGISALMYSSFVLGVALWIVYGLLMKDIAIIICNALTFSLSAPILYWVVKHKLKT